MNKAINTLVLATVDSLIKFKNKSAYYLAIFAMVFGSTFGTFNAANAATIAVGDGLTVTATDKDGAGGGALVATDSYTIDAATGIFSTGDVTAITIVDLDSITADSALSITGTAGLIINDLDATDALAITIADTSSLTVGGAATAAQPLSIALTDTAAVTFSGDETHDAIITAADDGDGTVTFSGATDYDAAIGANADDVGTLTITGASSIDAASFIKTVNVGANTDFTADINANVIDITGATTTATFGDKFLAASGASSVATMNATGQKIILDGADVISGDLTAATDGFGEVEVTVDNAANGMTGNIGTSTSVKVGLLDINKDLKTTGNVFVDATTIDDAEVLTLAGVTKTVTGTIDGDGAVEGNIVVNSGGDATKILTFTGDIGATNELKLLTLTTEATFEGSVKVDNIDLAAATTAVFKSDLTIGANDLTLGDATSTATFSGTSTQTITGGAGGEDILGTGVVQISNTSNGGAVFGSNAHLATNTLQLKLAANANLKNSVTGHILKDVTTLSGSSIILDDTIVANNIVFTATETLTEDSIHASSFLKMPANLDNGEAIVLFAEVKDADVVAITADVNSALVDTGLVDYVATTTNTDDITVTATETTDSAAATTLSVTTNEAKALRQARTAMIGTAADLDTLSEILSLSNGNTASNRTDFADQVAPQDDMISGSTFSTKAMTGSLQGIMSNRMASLRSGDAFVTGMSAGNGMSVNSGFIQAFGTEAEQKNTTVGSGTQFGYDASSSGLALGFDGITDNGSVVGLSFSMSSTDVDGKGTGKSKNDIDSYTVSVYADKTTDAGYIEGSLTLGLNENNSSRIVDTAGLNRTYKGDYDSEQVSLKIGGGMPNAVGTGFVTPYGSVTATRITTDAYTETSTTADDNLRLRVAQDDVDSIVGTVGLKYHTVLDNGGTPMISLAVNNEFGDNTINSSNTYQGGGTAFTTSTDVEELSATLGLGYSFRSDNTTLELAYEADANDDDYLGHYGSIKIVSKF